MWCTLLEPVNFGRGPTGSTFFKFSVPRASFVGLTLILILILSNTKEIFLRRHHFQKFQSALVVQNLTWSEYTSPFQWFERFEPLEPFERFERFERFEPLEPFERLERYMSTSLKGIGL